MGRPFRIKTQSHVKKSKEPEVDMTPMKSPYVKDKPTKVYPVFFNFNEQWEPDTKSFVINELSQVWEETHIINNDKYDPNIFPDRGTGYGHITKFSTCCISHNNCMCESI